MTTILFGRICRTCLKKSSDMKKLREFVTDDLQIEDMLNRSVPHFDLEMNDCSLPVEICLDCLGKLQTSYEFVQLCLRSNKELKNISTQQELEIDGTQVAVSEDKNQMNILKETDILMDNFKKEPQDENSCGSHDHGNGNQTNDAEMQIEAVKLEIDSQSRDRYEDNRSSDEYWPNDDKEDSDSNFSEKFSKRPINISKPSKYRQKAPLKKTSNKTCLHCNKVFAKKNLLTKHLSFHDSDKQFVCDTCNYRFSSERKLQTHISGNHTEVAINMDGGPYLCPDCPMIFQKSRALAAHRVMHLERDFKCVVCKINLKTMAAVTRHMNCKHPDVLPYKCHICDKSFPVENHLKDHVNEHTGHKKHKCEMCAKSFQNVTALKEHVRVHTGESPFLCPHCGKIFKTANVFRKHLQIHGEKKFHCPECPMKFSGKVNLTKHMTSHTKLKAHVCDICGSAFTRQDTLKAHKFKHSGERPFKCEDCYKTFVFKRHLKQHKITHTGKKPHMCSFCDRAYAASGDLVKHLRTHVGEKTYICDQCPESFKYLQDLKDHKNLHYKNKLDLITKEVNTVKMPQEDIEMSAEDA